MARATRKEKQLTLHFAGDGMVAVLTRVKKQAKAEFRTPEQQALFLLATHPDVMDARPFRILTPLADGWATDAGQEVVERDADETLNDDPRQLKLFDDDGDASKEAK